MPTSETSMRVTSVRSGFAFNLGGASGTLPIRQSLSGQTGFDLKTDTGSDGKVFTTIAASARHDVADPPTLAISATYDQRIEVEELDLTVRYSDIPSDSMLAVQCSYQRFSISRQGISGTSLIGMSATRIGPFSTEIDLLVWIPRLQDIRPSSSVTLSLSSINGSGGGPVRKVLLEKFVLALHT